MQHESHLPSEAPRTPLAHAELADDDIGFGDGLGAVVADVLLGDDDAHWASLSRRGNPTLILRGPSGIHPPACWERRRQSSDSWRRPPGRAFRAQLASGA